MSVKRIPVFVVIQSSSMENIAKGMRENKWATLADRVNLKGKGVGNTAKLTKLYHSFDDVYLFFSHYQEDRVNQKLTAVARMTSPPIHPVNQWYTGSHYGKCFNVDWIDVKGTHRYPFVTKVDENGEEIEDDPGNRDYYLDCDLLPRLKAAGIVHAMVDLEKTPTLKEHLDEWIVLYLKKL